MLRLLESEATQQRVSKAIKTSNWVHFACHGTQNSADPTESCLLLAGRSKLTLSEIIKLRPKIAELAFFSACETATGHEELAEEVVHLAAGMVLAGYRGIIYDDIAVQIADETYRRLFRGV